MQARLMVKKLLTVMGDTYARYLKTQNYHWNITGGQFKPLHDLFETQYKELAEAVDTIAERVRAMGERAPGTFEELMNLKTIQDGDKNADGEEMLQQLAHDQHVMLTTLEKALDTARQANDEVTINLLVERMTVHAKNAWMLESSIEHKHHYMTMKKKRA